MRRVSPARAWEARSAGPAIGLRLDDARDPRRLAGRPALVHDEASDESASDPESVASEPVAPEPSRAQRSHVDPEIPSSHTYVHTLGRA